MNELSETLWLKGEGNLEKLLLPTSSGACAEIYRYGAHLTSWRTASGREWIFTSRQAEFVPGKAIRGGVPIIFPQFNAFGPGPRHGFARNQFWQLRQAPAEPTAENQCAFELTDSAATHAVWDHAFRAESSVSISDQQLRLGLSVTNTDSKPLQFTAALHTYFAVDDFTKARLLGLAGLRYWDNDGSDFQQRQSAADDVLSFSGAIDRVYFAARQPLTLIDGAQRLQIESEGFSEVVVWNPGPAAAQKMADMADDEWRNMICIEAAVIDHPLSLAPGEVWQGCQVMTSL
jgi:glucose-6-phosphate 1-epimerase